jgi:hypothetical protein
MLMHHIVSGLPHRAVSGRTFRDQHSSCRAALRWSPRGGLFGRRLFVLFENRIRQVVEVL